MKSSLAFVLLVMICACEHEKDALARGTPHPDAGRAHANDTPATGTGGTNTATGTGGSVSSTGMHDAAAMGTGGAVSGTGMHDAGTMGSGGAASELDAGAPAIDCGPACRSLPSGAAYFLKCCGTTCTDTGNDPHNCGSCDHQCPAEAAYCEYGTCKPTPCQTSCDGGSCCGYYCCGAGETCCGTGGPQGPTPSCVMLSEGETCPFACYDCMCASPTTPIATPSGERAIADLVVGDLVYSVDHDAIVAVPITRVNRTPVPATHRVLRVTLANGRTLEVSGGHPLATRGTFDDLEPGGTLDETQVLGVQSVRYGYEFTYDILPASDTATYFAAGVRIGSTLAKQR
jgi:hypothetical protein